MRDYAQSTPLHLQALIGTTSVATPRFPMVPRHLNYNALVISTLNSIRRVMQSHERLLLEGVADWRSGFGGILQLGCRSANAIGVGAAH